MNDDNFNDTSCWLFNTFDKHLKIFDLTHKNKVKVDKAFYLIWCFNCGSNVEHKTKSWGCSVEIIKYCHMNDNRGKLNYIQLRLDTSASFNQEDTIKPITVESSKREALHSDILYTYSTLVIWDKDGTTARGQCRHQSYNLIKLVTYDQIF